MNSDVPRPLRFCLLAPLCLAASALAQDKTAAIEALIELDLEALLDVKVTAAAKIAQKTSEAPSTISVVTREQIERFGWRSLNDVLYRLPGFGPGQDYDRPTVPARGLSEGWNANHLLHLVDGIPMNSNLYGAAFTSEITSLNFARSLEIIRGPGSALYGSNATNGVVQVNTLSPDDLQGRTFMRLEGGGQDSRRYDLAMVHDGDVAAAVATFNGFATNGNEYLSYDGSGRVDANGELQRAQTRDERSSSYFFGKLNFHQQLDGLMLQYHHQEWAFDTGHGWLWWIPDFDEAMTEYRDILALKYQPPSQGRLSQEYVVRYQRHELSWNQRFYPNGAFAGYYPNGMWEYIKTHADDIFVRAQYGYGFDNSVHGLLGIEGDRFLYQGDDEHYSNINVDSEFFEPFPGDQPTPLGPYLDFVVDRPVVNQAIYAQLSSGRWLGDSWQITAGARHDRLDVDYRSLYEAGQPNRNRSFAHTSPRLALVFTPQDDLALKLLWGEAFRAPSPTELAGAHTFAVASNIDQLEPELLTTAELAADWRLNHALNLRVNLFETEAENQIAYSTQNNNLSTNVLSQTTRGLELELLFHFPTDYGSASGFGNWSYATRGDETVLDNTIAEHDHQQTGEPEHRANFGLNLEGARWQWSFTGHYQGTVHRRASDVGLQTLPLGVGVVLDLDQYRRRKVPAWATVDTQLSVEPVKSLRVGLRITNLLDEDEAFLVKTGPFPFDYRQPGRVGFVFLQLEM